MNAQFYIPSYKYHNQTQNTQYFLKSFEMAAKIGPIPLRMFGVARVMLGVSRAARTERPPESEPLKFVSFIMGSGQLIAFSGQ